MQSEPCMRGSVYIAVTVPLCQMLQLLRMRSNSTRWPKPGTGRGWGEDAGEEPLCGLRSVGKEGSMVPLVPL